MLEVRLVTAANTVTIVTAIQIRSQLSDKKSGAAALNLILTLETNKHVMLCYLKEHSRTTAITPNL